MKLEITHDPASIVVTPTTPEDLTTIATVLGLRAAGDTLTLMRHEELDLSDPLVSDAKLVTLVWTPPRPVFINDNEDEEE